MYIYIYIHIASVTLLTLLWRTVKALRGCWNSSVCQSHRLLVACSSTAKICCKKESTWTCPAGRHEYQLKLCSDGQPTACPGCNEDLVNREIEVGCLARVDLRPESTALHKCVGNRCIFWFPYALLRQKRQVLTSFIHSTASLHEKFCVTFMVASG